MYFFPPVYHQHVDDHHLEPLEHTDHSSPHSPNDYSVTSHESIIEPEIFVEKSHDTHYHLHYEKQLYRFSRIDKNKVKAISTQTLEAFNILPTTSPAVKKYSYAYYKPQYYSNRHTKTYSGLSPPVYST